MGLRMLVDNPRKTNLGSATFHHLHSLENGDIVTVINKEIDGRAILVNLTQKSSSLMTLNEMIKIDCYPVAKGSQLKYN